MWAAVALAFALAMDATAVSAARALAVNATRRELVILPLVFGGFQSGMAALGWLGGESIGPYLAGWDRRIGCALLCAIGLKMIVDAVRDDDAAHTPGTMMVYAGLGIATSIDAAAAGLTLPLVPVAPVVALVLIGGITAGCSVVGYLAGRAVGRRFGGHLGVLGGAVLIAIGIDLLIGHA
jgi:manganese efflux pump family protein